MLSTTLVLQAILTLTVVCLAAPHRYPMNPPVVVPQGYYEVQKLRASTELNPHAIVDTKCLDSHRRIVYHDENVAELSICGGISGSTSHCSGSPAETTGQSGTAKFSLRTVEPGATINMSKAHWEQCARAARAVCPTGSLRSTCVGGATKGNVVFTLENP